MTNDPLRRLKQHNGELSGGARATRGHQWRHVMILSGFPTMRDALQFEWYWKYVCRKQRRGILSRMEKFVKIWIRGYSSSSSVHFCDYTNPFFMSFSESGMEILKKIDGFQSLIDIHRAPSEFKISNYFSFQLFPFQKMSSVSNTIVTSAAPTEAKKPRKPKTVAPVVIESAPTEVEHKEHKETKTKKPKAAKADTDADDASKEKKPRKPKTVTAIPAPAPETDDENDDVSLSTIAALPGSTVAIAADTKPVGAPLVRTAAVHSESEAETEASVAAPAEKKPRKPRTKKVLVPAVDPALESLDDAGKIAYLLAEVSVLKKQLAAVLEGRAADKASEKKLRKKREPKAKAVCPEAEDGVIRFHSTLKNNYIVFNNSYKSEIQIDGVMYPTVEHYYQCAKFIETAPEYAEKMRNTANPALVKNMGRTKKVEARADWDEVHLEIMRIALVAKMDQHENIRNLLAETGDATLELESPSDPFWGIGADGNGENYLGKLLADIRTSL